MAKRLIVCCDGTWNRADGKCPTNVVRLAVSLGPTDVNGNPQRVYYHPGVGTGRWDRFRGGAFGVGLSANVTDAYRFLVDNFEPGDQLYFFGFSRGAYTARSVAGLVRNCGILRRENAGRIGDAYRLYRDKKDKPRGVNSTMFRSAYSYETDIRFIGVWDTVGALGIPPIGPRFLQGLMLKFNKQWSFHDTDLSTRVRAAFQALAIDEQRSAFKPTLWHKQPAAQDQILEQVWFSGVHCNVGGGLPNSGLSDLALLWMVQKAQEHELVFRSGALAPRQPGGEDLSEPGSTIDVTVAPDAMRVPDNSRTGFYRLARAYQRPIGYEEPLDGKNHDDDPNKDICGYGQFLSDSAFELYTSNTRPPGEQKRYQPEELKKYLESDRERQPVPVPTKFDPSHH